ncbi:hypothetical protein ACWCRC_32835 [Streptomyces sp. NPDC001940]
MSLATAVRIAPSPDRLLDAPLAELLTETGVEVIDSPIRHRGFYGAVVQLQTGELLLSMPPGRDESEHDIAARYLLAQVFDVDLPELQVPFTTSEIRSAAPREMT